MSSSAEETTTIASNDALWYKEGERWKHGLHISSSSGPNLPVAYAAGAGRGSCASG
jgi:hypothetical protein